MSAERFAVTPDALSLDALTEQVMAHHAGPVGAVTSFLGLVRAENVVGDAETAFAELRSRYGKGLLPRTVNMITGPSRSGDIEQTMLFGAHGPRRLHIIVVG